MKIVMLSNFINHHQAPVADELYNNTGVEYWFIETMQLPEEQRNLGYSDLSGKPYVIKSYISDVHYKRAISLINDADIVIYGSSPKEMIRKRYEANKLIFYYAERFFKKRPWYFPNPRVFYAMYKNHTVYRHRNVYMLAASAYTANDVSHFFAYPNKIYKWGYFPAVDMRKYEEIRSCKANTDCINIMWCGRFLDWKHPELPVKLARLLKTDQLSFHIEMYGNGEEWEYIKKLCKELDVTDVVTLHGSKPNAEIIEAMHNHDIFIFTSDHNEGWGAVLNESMSQGCAVVASDMIGSAPFLIENNINGLLFKSKDLQSLHKQVRRLIEDINFREILSQNAVRTMQETWCPQIAAQRLVHLSERLLNGQDTDYIEGPCSKAYPF